MFKHTQKHSSIQNNSNLQVYLTAEFIINSLYFELLIKQQLLCMKFKSVEIEKGASCSVCIGWSDSVSSSECHRQLYISKPFPFKYITEKKSPDLVN